MHTKVLWLTQNGFQSASARRCKPHPASDSVGKRDLSHGPRLLLHLRGAEVESAAEGRSRRALPVVPAGLQLQRPVLRRGENSRGAGRTKEGGHWREYDLKLVRRRTVANALVHSHSSSARLFRSMGAWRQRLQQDISQVWVRRAFQSAQT